VWYNTSIITEINREDNSNMKKRIIQALVVVLFLLGMLAVGARQAEEIHAKNVENVYYNEEENIIDVNTTIINAINESIDLNTIRIEQMFVIDTYIDEETEEYVIVLEDNHGFTWECTDMDVYLYEDVLVLMTNMNTEDITDDEFIHCWVSIE
jgi:hypothetical protein